MFGSIGGEQEAASVEVPVRGCGLGAPRPSGPPEPRPRDRVIAGHLSGRVVSSPQPATAAAARSLHP
ncbi:unnamed protein product [Gadus morhua 'NCC']